MAVAKQVLKQHLPEHFQRKASLCWGPGLLQQPQGAPNWTKGDHSVDSALPELPQVAAPTWCSHSCHLRLLCQHGEVQLLNPGGYSSFTGDAHPQREQASHRALCIP